MRSILFMAIWTISCSNPKEKIVNEQIKVKMAMDTLKMDLEAAETMYSVSKVSFEAGEALRESDPSYKSDETKESIDSMRRASYEIEFEIDRAQKKFDSLEMELKKY